MPAHLSQDHMATLKEHVKKLSKFDKTKGLSDTLSKTFHLNAEEEEKVTKEELLTARKELENFSGDESIDREDEEAISIRNAAKSILVLLDFNKILSEYGRTSPQAAQSFSDAEKRPSSQKGDSTSRLGLGDQDPAQERAISGSLPPTEKNEQSNVKEVVASENQQSDIEKLKDDILKGIYPEEKKSRGISRGALDNLSKYKLKDILKISVHLVSFLLSCGSIFHTSEKEKHLNKQNYFVALCRLMEKYSFSARDALRVLIKLNSEKLFWDVMRDFDPKSNLLYFIDAIVVLMKKGKYPLDAKTAVRIWLGLEDAQNLAIKKYRELNNTDEYRKAFDYCVNEKKLDPHEMSDLLRYLDKSSLEDILNLNHSQLWVLYLFSNHGLGVEDVVKGKNLSDTHIRLLIRLTKAEKETEKEAEEKTEKEISKEISKEILSFLNGFTFEKLQEIEELSDQEILLLVELQPYGMEACHFRDNAKWFCTKDHFNALRNLLAREENPLKPTEALSILEDLSDSEFLYSGYKLKGIEHLSDEVISLWREKAVKDTGLVAEHFNNAERFDPVAHREPFIYLVKKIYNKKGHEGPALKFGDQIHQRAKEKFQREVIKSACEKYLLFRNQHAPGSRLGRFSHWSHGSSGLDRVKKLKTTIEYMENIESVEEESDHKNNAYQINKLAKKVYSASGEKKNSFASYFDRAVEDFETDTKTFFQSITGSDALPFLMDESWDSFKQKITASQEEATISSQKEISPQR